MSWWSWRRILVNFALVFFFLFLNAYILASRARVSLQFFFSCHYLLSNRSHLTTKGSKTSSGIMRKTWWMIQHKTSVGIVILIASKQEVAWFYIAKKTQHMRPWRLCFYRFFLLDNNPQVMPHYLLLPNYPFQWTNVHFNSHWKLTTK